VTVNVKLKQHCSGQHRMRTDCNSMWVNRYTLHKVHQHTASTVSFCWEYNTSQIDALKVFSQYMFNFSDPQSIPSMLHLFLFWFFSLAFTSIGSTKKL
jgi:hypothetical protein